MLILGGGSWEIASQVRRILRALDATEPRAVNTIAAEARLNGRAVNDRLRQLRPDGLVVEAVPKSGRRGVMYVLTDAGSDLARLVRASEGELKPMSLPAGARPLRLRLSELRERNGWATVEDLARTAGIPATEVGALEEHPSPLLREVRRVVSALDGELLTLAATPWQGGIVPLAVAPGPAARRRSAEAIAEHLEALGIRAAAGGDGTRELWVARLALSRARLRQLAGLSQPEHRARIEEIHGTPIPREGFDPIELWDNPRVRMLDVHLGGLGAASWLLARTPAVTALLRFPELPDETLPWEKRLRS